MIDASKEQKQKQIQLMASTILAGLLANKNVVSNDISENELWSITAYAVRLAKTIIAATAEVSKK